MSTRNFNTRKALRGHLLELSLPPVAWENQVFTPPDPPEPYIRETLMPADETLTANRETTAIGIYQVDLFVPIGYSVSQAEDLADQIKEHFRPARIIGQVKIERAAVGQAVEDNPWRQIPIQIDYRTHQMEATQ